MKYSAKRMESMLRQIKDLSLPTPPGMLDLPAETIRERCNGIGSDSGALKYLVEPTTFVFSWMELLAVSHDLWWSDIYNDGSRERFEQSNREFEAGAYILAGRSFSWVWPKALRESLRSARRWEGREARRILMSDKCWAVWSEHAEIEPGPEAQG